MNRGPLVLEATALPTDREYGTVSTRGLLKFVSHLYQWQRDLNTKRPIHFATAKSLWPKSLDVFLPLAKTWLTFS